MQITFRPVKLRTLSKKPHAVPLPHAALLPLAAHLPLLPHLHLFVLNLAPALLNLYAHL